MKRTTAIIIYILSCIALSACSGGGGQFSGWKDEVFDTTAITETRTTKVVIGNQSSKDEQHLLSADFEPATNVDGDFRIEKIEVGDHATPTSDIVIPPGGVLTLTVVYAPQNLNTSVADYGGWVTGTPARWEPKPVPAKGAKAMSKGVKVEAKDGEAIHRALISLVYDAPRDGILYVHLVGTAKPGPNGEVIAGGKPGECTPGEGVACYLGGLALDIPDLAPGGPKDLVLTGSIRFMIDGSAVTLLMDEFPPALLTLRSTEIPQLPSGVTATLILSGAPGKQATGTFDGSRLELSAVAFRIRVVLGELQPEQVTPGMSAIVDFTIDDLKITTTEPLTQGAITLHLETKLSEHPSGNQLFDQFLAGAKVVAIMKGQLAF